MEGPLGRYRRMIDEKSAELNYFTKIVDRGEKDLVVLQKEAREIEEAQRIIQLVAEDVQNKSHIQLTSIVTQCLRTVFGEEAYEFHIDFVKSRGKTEAHIKLTRNGKSVEPLDSVGGGVIDIVSFAIRLTHLILSMPSKRRLLVLDEPFRFVHGEENRQRLVHLLKTLAETTQTQIIMATGLDYLRIGKVVEI